MDLLASSLGDVGDFITGIATGVIALTAIATAGFALTQYRKDVGERHGRWLMDLSARFADAPRHEAMLLELYRGDESDLAKALAKRQAIRDDGSGDTLDEAERKLLVAMDDYFGFFELVGRLYEEKVLTSVEADALFEWYLDEPMQIAVVRKEVERFFIPVVELHRQLCPMKYRQVDGRFYYVPVAERGQAERDAAP
jgi:hypothetical protein